MFVLAEMKDVIRIKPFNFVYNVRESLEFGLNKKFANKVSGRFFCIKQTYYLQFFSAEVSYMCSS